MCELTGKDYKNSKIDGYPQFEKVIQRFFDNTVNGNKKLFTTNVENLFEVFLENLPTNPEIHLNAQIHYNCNACRQFINRFGGLVTIDEEGVTKSAIWDEETIPEFFLPAVKAMKKSVLNGKVNGVFIAEARVLGTPRTGEWTHLSIKLPQELLNRSVIRTANQLMAEKKEDFRILINSLQDYSLDTVNKALTLIQSETMYRSDRVEGVAKWFKELIEKRDSIFNSNHKTNITWLAVATAPAGFTHVRSSMIGTLLDDIKEGYSTRVVAARFAEKMNPTNFMRSQSAPSANAIYEAEKIVEKLGIANSLQRRYATLEEIPFTLWKPKQQTKTAKKSSIGVFGHLIAKAKQTEITLPKSIMTWEKFNRTVLPTAENLEVLLDNPNRFMALVTASDSSAENILQWNNTFSWYYHGGIDGEIKRRVEEAGGRYENNEIRASLIWEGGTDLDFHVYTPLGEEIFFGSKRDRRGGYLDVDANGGRVTSYTPVENIRWSNNAPEGRYRFFVHNYLERGNGTTPYKVELEVNGKIYVFNGIASGTGYSEDVFVFDYKKGEEPRMLTHSHSTSNVWGAQANEFVKVNAVTTSPNLWGEKIGPQAGTHIFFILDGVKDESEGKGRGFFNETLKSELREIRKTLELFTANTPIQGSDNATACGVGYSKEYEWKLTVRVTSNNSTRIIKIDRWD